MYGLLDDNTDLNFKENLFGVVLRCEAAKVLIMTVEPLMMTVTMMMISFSKAVQSVVSTMTFRVIENKYRQRANRNDVSTCMLPPKKRKCCYFRSFFVNTKTRRYVIIKFASRSDRRLLKLETYETKWSFLLVCFITSVRLLNPLIPNLVSIIFKNLVHTSKKAHAASPL
jgi:hypothetical protein